jgi:hypothetical protein
MVQIAKRRTQSNDKRLVGEHHPNWKGGKRMNNGYIEVKSPTHPYKGKEGYVREHRLVMESHLGRYLKPDEEVHHINGVKDDNLIENLQLITHREHMRLHNCKPEIANRVCYLCGSHETRFDKHGWFVWHRGPIEGQFMCHRCKNKQRYRH